MFKTVCLSGGGVNGYAQIGMLQYLYENGQLDLLDTIVATSVGTIVGFLYLMEIPPLGIQEVLCLLDPLLCLTFSCVEDFFEKYGVDSGEYFIAQLVDILVSHNMNPLITFKQLQLVQKKRLIICGTRVNTHDAFYFSSKSTPDMKILEAVRISISIPFLFSSVQYNGDYYVDGFLTDNYPIDYAIKDYKSRYPFEELRVIGCLLVSLIPRSCDTFENYIYNIFSCVLKKNIKDKEVEENTTIKINFDNSPINFNLSLVEKKELFRIGYEKTRNFILSRKIIKKRRKSI